MFKNLNTVKYWRSRKEAKLAEKAKGNKLVEYRLKLELQQLLNQYLSSYDRIMLEVSPKVLTEFTNVIADEAFSWLVVTQVDANKYVFAEREVAI
jgi:hypothetical protein